jgi:uncharacterized protein (DUF1684 family)
MLLLLATLAQVAVTAPAPSSFAAEWKSWHEQRLARLTAPRGWLALSGIHWLTEGENRIEGLPGRFTLAQGKVTLNAAVTDGYQWEGKPDAFRQPSPF